MNRRESTKTLCTMFLAASLLPLAAGAHDSGSTGSDGAFNPTVDTVLQLPPDGIFNFTSVNIPVGVTVTFTRNATNTPVVMLASGDIIIDGTLHVNGGWSMPAGAAGDGNLGDDGLPGLGGAGGYDGGRGGESGVQHGGEGHGPGAGQGGSLYQSCPSGISGMSSGSGGGGGGFGVAGSGHQWVSYHPSVALGGPSYGSEFLLPLVGGSGGGGAGGGVEFNGSGGGGAGGALLIAASGTVRITTTSGAIRADGGSSGEASGIGVGGTGGGGSGGAIRIVATRIEGNGAITARGGLNGTAAASQYCNGGDGGKGRIRLEAESFARTANTDPQFSFDEPAPVFIAGLPSLRITRVAGIDAPAQPTGNGDIVLPVDAPNPVIVEFETTGVPVGNTVKLTITPAYGDSSFVVSPALTGSTEQASASVAIEIPAGPSVLFAQTTYTVIEAVGEALSVHTGGERVESVRLSAALNGESTVTLVTVSGREVTLPAHVPLMPLS
ncbi:MAG TPA: hypothetical protein VF275_06925 [Gammaproteobacteria bacterium]